MSKTNQYRNTIAVELLAALTRLVVRAPAGASCCRLEDPAPDHEPEELLLKLADGRAFIVRVEELHWRNPFTPGG